MSGDKLAFETKWYKCPQCNDVIGSYTSGQYVSCTCEECAIDQTTGYIRIIGPAIKLNHYQDEYNGEYDYD